MNSLKRFLILYLSIGSGHLSAAAAIKKSIKQAGEDYKVFCEDLFTPAIRDSVIPEFLSLNSTLFFPKVYDSAWQSGSLMPGYEILQTTPLLKNRVLELLSLRKPDMVICTHSLPCSILAGMKLDGAEIPPIAAIATDYMVHPYWPVQGVDGFVVGSREAADRFASRDVDKEKIKLFGIPIDPIAERLSMQKQSDSLKRDVLSPIKVMILAGGKRLAPYVTTWPKTINLLNESIKLPDKRIDWNVVCGKPSAFSQILSETVSVRENIHLFDYVPDFLELLSQQDFVITKPGGLILAESTALGVPVILVSRGGGQEAANYEIIMANRCGVEADSEKDVFDYLQDVLNYPYILKDAKEAAFQFGKPAAARLTAEWLLGGMQ